MILLAHIVLSMAVINAVGVVAILLYGIAGE